jgi:hypothetical protein
MNVTNLDMHRDHRDWDAETCFWRDDVRAWQHELAQARAELKELGAIFAARERRLCMHAGAVRLHEEKPDAHEHAIAEAERTCGANPCKAAGHAHEALQHVVDRDEHERIKRRHHEFMTHWRVLKAELARID